MEELIHGKEGEIATVNVRNGFKNNFNYSFKSHAFVEILIQTKFDFKLYLGFTTVKP